jgi:hypothetical protein
MPKNVRLFVWLWFSSFVIAFAGVPLLPPPDLSLTRLGVTWPIEIGLVAGVQLIILIILLPFFWLAVSRRRNWARWLLLVAFVAPLPLAFDPNMFDRENLPSTAVSFLSLLVEAAAFYFLFTGDARAWFERQ